MTPHSPYVITTAMVLAAGLGTRLRPLTDTTPKPLVNVGGLPVIIRSLIALKNAGIQRAVINTHHLAPMLEEAVKAANPGLTLHFSREETLLETGGGIKKALPLLGEDPFVVVNSDAVWLEDACPLLRPLMNRFDVRAHDVLMAVVPTRRTTGFRNDGGDFVLDAATGRLSRPADRALADVVYAGIHVMHPAFLALEGDGAFSLTRPWAEAARAGRLHGWLYDAPWVDMGSPTGLACARELIGQQKA